MSLNLSFIIGRLLNQSERLTPARVNAIVRGISASITGLVGTTDLSDGAVTPPKMSQGAFAYSTGTQAGTTYTAVFTPAVAAYVDGLWLNFKSDTTNVGAVSFDAGPGAKPIRKRGGTALEAGDIPAGGIVILRYNTTLVAGGCFEMLSLTATDLRPAQAALVGVRNFTAKNNAGTPLSKVDAACDEAVLKDTTGNPLRVATVAVTCDITANGANGLDTGAEAGSTWYYLWLIAKSDGTVAGLLSVSATAPTMPATYTYKALVGVVRNGIPGGVATDFMTFYQQEHDVFLNLTTIFTAKAAVADNTYEAYSAGGGGADVDLTTVVPPTARRLRGTIGDSSVNNNQSMAIAADANGLGACLNVAAAVGATNFMDGYSAANGFDIPLKTAQTIYWKTPDHTTARNRMSVTGFSI